jgi:hypothetical protein
MPSRIDVVIDVHYDRINISLDHDGTLASQPDAAVVTLRQSIIDALATRRDVTTGDGGPSRNAAEVRFDPRHAISVDCRLRPAAAPRG